MVNNMNNKHNANHIYRRLSLGVLYIVLGMAIVLAAFSAQITNADSFFDSPVSPVQTPPPFRPTPTNVPTPTASGTLLLPPVFVEPTPSILRSEPTPVPMPPTITRSNSAPVSHSASGEASGIIKVVGWLRTVFAKWQVRK